MSDKARIWKIVAMIFGAISILAMAYCIGLVILTNYKDSVIEDYKDEDVFEDYIDLVEVASRGRDTIYYDANTGVMYFVRDDHYNIGWAITIYDEDGLPRLYDGGYIDYAEKRNELQSGD